MIIAHDHLIRPAPEILSAEVYAAHSVVSKETNTSNERSEERTIFGSEHGRPSTAPSIHIYYGSKPLYILALSQNFKYRLLTASQSANPYLASRIVKQTSTSSEFFWRPKVSAIWSNRYA